MKGSHFEVNCLDHALSIVSAVVVLLVLVIPTPAWADDGGDVACSEDTPSSRIELKQWGLGPFEVRDPSILGELRAAPMARSPRTLAPGAVEAGIRQTQESTFAYADDLDAREPNGKSVHRLTIDGETRDTNLVFRVGVLPRVELGVELDAVHYQGGGYLDGLIDFLHQTTGMGTLRRDQVPAHSWIVEGSEPSGRKIQFASAGIGLGDAYLTPRVLVTEGGDYYPAVSLTLSIWVPTASPGLMHAHGLAETFSLDASKRIADLPIVLYFGGAVTNYDQAGIHGLHLTRDRLMGYLGLEWEVTSRVSLVTHFWQESRRETRLYRATDSQRGNEIQYIAFGVKAVPLPGVRVELGALESFDKSVGGDFGFLANVWITFDSGGLVDSESSKPR